MFWQWKDNVSNLCDEANAVLNGTFTTINAYVRKEEKS